MKDNAYFEMYENELTHPWYRATRKILIKFLKDRLNKNSYILDAGCGTGGTIMALKKAGFDKVTGIDNSKLALELCKKNGITNTILANVNRLPFKPQSFDAVICLDVLYHKGVSEKQALKEFSRVLKPGGILYLEEPAFNWLFSKHDIAIETEHRFTKKQLVRLAKSADFKIIKSTYFNTFLFLPILIKRLSYKFSREKNPESDVYPIHPLLGNFMNKLFGIELAIIDKISLPIGLSIICIGQK